MAKVDVLLALLAASCASTFTPQRMKVYADCGVARNTLQWICQNQPDNGDVMAIQAVEFADGTGPKPTWMVQAGL